MKILLVGDQPGWAFDNIMDFGMSHFRDKYDMYYDFHVYHPKHPDPNQEPNKATTNLTYKKHDSWMSSIPVLRGIEFRIRRWLNQRGILEFNEHFKKQRLDSNDEYDLVVFLDFSFKCDGDFDHISSKFEVLGTFNEAYPPRKLSRHPKTGEISEIKGQEFFDLFFSGADAIVIGAESIRKLYEPLTDKPLFYINMAYDEELFNEKSQKSNSEALRIGWTGNPSRKFKGFHDIIVPAIEELKHEGYNVELKTQHEGSLDSLPAFWHGVDVAVITSSADAGPSLFMEASLCGVPSISNRVGWPDFVIEHEQNGLFIERTKEDLKKAIVRLIEEPELLKKITKNIRSSSIEKIGIEAQKERWSNLFRHFEEQV